ncbi:MAG: cupin domain-containing protein [Pseudomonadota bacterium]|nr:cupin domain-containing protein [Pseudomonadota bacterium]
MANVIQIRVILGVLAGVCLSSQPAPMAQQALESHVVPLKHSSIGTLDKRVEAVHGDRTKPGEPFVIRIHAEAGYIVMPHTHPIDEHIVVVKGSWAVGMGDRFKKEALEPMEVGDYGFAPRQMAHFALSKSETILQVHGVGPFLTLWVVPVYEITAHGVLLKTGAEDPGRLVSTVPPECFALKLGIHVRGRYGDGVVIGAQCTPGELTQYRVESHAGRFWAQGDELTAL